MKKTAIITRKMYVDGKATSRQYYGQFVTEEMKQHLLSVYKRGYLLSVHQADPHFNAINLRTWEGLTGPFKEEIQENIRAAGDFWSLKASVCILKEAARQLVS